MLRPSGSARRRQSRLLPDGMPASFGGLCYLARPRDDCRLLGRRRREPLAVKSYWNLAVGACVGIAIGFVVRGLVGGGAPLGTALKPAAVAARRDAPQQQGGADPIYKVGISAAP